MNRFRVNIVLFLLFFLSAGFAYPQEKLSPEEVLFRMNQVYSSATSISMEFEVKMSGDKNGESKIHKGKMYYSGEYYLLDYMNSIVLINPDCFLMVDHSKKVMVYNKDKNKKKRTAAEDPNEMINKIISGPNVKLSFVESSKEYWRISIKSGNSSYKNMIVTVSVKDFTIQRFTYNIENQADSSPVTAVNIKYHNISFNKKIAKDLFSEKKFIKRTTGDKISPVDPFKSYRFVDQTK